MFWRCQGFGSLGKGGFYKFRVCGFKVCALVPSSSAVASSSSPFAPASATRESSLCLPNGVRVVAALIPRRPRSPRLVAILAAVRAAVPLVFAVALHAGSEVRLVAVLVAVLAAILCATSPEITSRAKRATPPSNR